ncbi:arsenate reductase (glutaredoxin) [Flavobacterium sp.]|jgi:arsenate reductase|uniref:arsenate reductase (glutaredoxin) n=1 Tax=Flavobacterium sp. TaxID=239 RepID=UPI0037C0701C
MITIYHNPRCGKSRECLAFIETSNHQFKVVKYLENPLNFNELSELIRKLKLTPIELIRTKESIWVENYKSRNLSDTEIIQSMVDHPILMIRPIAVYGEKAVIARPLERIKEIF